MENCTETLRKVDALGRVVLPVELRRHFDIRPEDALEIIANTDEEGILLKKISPCCLRCRSKSHLIHASGQLWLCQDCLSELSRSPH